MREHDRHLQEDPEEVANVVGAVLGKALGTVAPLQQEGPAGRDIGQLVLEVARLAGKDQRREVAQLRLGGLQPRLVDDVPGADGGVRER